MVLPGCHADDSRTQCRPHAGSADDGTFAALGVGCRYDFPWYSRSMIKKLFALIVIGTLAAVAYYFWTVSPSASPFPFEGSIHDRIDAALENASIDVSEFGGGIITLENGEASFSAGEDVGGGRGSVQLGDSRAVVVKGADADVLVLVHINGGGTGIFQDIEHFEYIGSEDKV